MTREKAAVKSLKHAHIAASDEYEAHLLKSLNIRIGAPKEEEAASEAQVVAARCKLELSRFDLIGELNSLAMKKKFQLCDRVCGAVYGFLGYHHTCHSQLAVVESSVRELSIAASKGRKLFAREELLRTGKRNQLERDLQRNEGHWHKAVSQLSPDAQSNKQRRRASMSYSYTRKSLSFDVSSDDDAAAALGGDGSGSESPTVAGAASDANLSIDDSGGEEKAGFLHKKSHTGMRHTWQRRWFFIKQGKLYYLRDAVETIGQKTAQKIIGGGTPAPKAKATFLSTNPEDEGVVCVGDLVITNVKLGDRRSGSRKYTFEVVSPTTRKYYLQADNEEDCQSWVEAIQGQIMKSLSTLSVEPSSSGATVDNGAASSEVPEEILATLKRENPFCGDCGTAAPQWVSANLGLLMCIDCSGVHRSLGSHVSKVRSLALDLWSPSSLELLMKIGNTGANEAYLPESSAILSLNLVPAALRKETLFE